VIPSLHFLQVQVARKGKGKGKCKGKALPEVEEHGGPVTAKNDAVITGAQSTCTYGFFKMYVGDIDAAIIDCGDVEKSSSVAPNYQRSRVWVKISRPDPAVHKVC
jgi:hypothetical protein